MAKQSKTVTVTVDASAKVKLGRAGKSIAELASAVVTKCDQGVKSPKK
jgi:hypothetical protein